MAAPSELGGDFVDVHLVALGAETEARQFGLQLLKDAGDDYRGDGADVVNQSFRVVAVGTGAREVGFLEPVSPATG